MEQQLVYIPPKLYSLTDDARIQKGIGQVTVQTEDLSDRRLGLVLNGHQSYAATIRFDGGYQCSCEDCLLSKRFCKHLVAVFFSFPDSRQLELLPLMLQWKGD